MNENMELTFFVKSREEWLPEIGKNKVYLKIDNWNDYSYQTLYSIVLFDENGTKYDLEHIKIANFGQTTEERVELPRHFNSLDEGFFSLGQSDAYYSTIQNLNPELKEKFLKGLRDIVFDEELQERALGEEVTTTSLLRTTSITTVKGQYKRILDGGAILTPYHFEYQTEQTEHEAGYNLTFKVVPESNPPTNIHILIGRNGVGKTHLLNNMIKTLINEENKKGDFRAIANEDTDFCSSNGSVINDDNVDFFSSVVSVSYSAFDPFKPYPTTGSFKYLYIGLKEINSDGKLSLKNHDKLRSEFVNSFEYCYHVGKREKFKKAI